MPFNKVFLDTLYDEAWLRRVYVDENRNAAQVAKLIGCTRQAVHAALRKHGILVKGLSEAQQVSEAWTGSDAPRPRGAFSGTLHDKGWLLEQLLGGPSLATIGAAAGCSPSGVLKALERAGLDTQWRQCRQQRLDVLRAARSPSRKRDFVPRSKHSDTQGAAHARARRAVPEGPCVLCDAPGYDVGHKDGNPFNDAPENLERLCRLHHRRQHGYEHAICFEVLAAMGVPRIRIYNEARRRLLLEDNMSKDKVSASDSVSVGLERTPPKLKLEESTRFCSKCASIAIKHGSDPDELICTNPECGQIFRSVPN